MPPREFALAPCPTDTSLLEETPVRVTYHDTDQMGHVYYGNYLTWFEMGRTEWLRSRGGTYRELERGGIYLPVSECWCDYQRPAFYDDLLTIVTWVAEVRRVSVRFGYEIRCDARGERLARGWTRHGFVDQDRKVVAGSPELLALLRGTDSEHSRKEHG